MIMAMTRERALEAADRLEEIRRNGTFTFQDDAALQVIGAELALWSQPETSQEEDASEKLTFVTCYKPDVCPGCQGANLLACQNLDGSQGSDGRKCEKCDLLWQWHYERVITGYWIRTDI